MGGTQVDGTPTDCVMLAVQALMPERPDFVLSGINHGHNMGEDVLYSGTVAAAMEGIALGIPSIAFSFASRDHGTDVHLVDSQIGAITDLLRHFVSLRDVPPTPCSTSICRQLPGPEIKGVRLTRLGRRVFSDSLKRMRDPWDKEIYWIGGGTIAWSGGPDCDFRAVGRRLHLGRRRCTSTSPTSTCCLPRSAGGRSHRRRGRAGGGAGAEPELARPAAPAPRHAARAGHHRPLRAPRDRPHAAPLVRAARRFCIARTRTRHFRSAAARRFRSRPSTRGTCRSSG